MKDLTLIAIFTALITICAWISLPFTVPFTFQILGVFLAVLVLGEKKALISITLYLVMGLIGIPVFAKFSAGIGVLFGPTGGFLIGFILIDLVFWLTTLLFGKNKFTLIIGLVAGIIACYIAGTLFYILLYAKSANFIDGLLVCVVPYIIPDTIKLIIAVVIYYRVRYLIEPKNVVE